MNYLIAVVAMPVLMVVWVVVQRMAGYDPDEDGTGRCVGCTCGRSLDSCEKQSAGQA